MSEYRPRHVIDFHTHVFPERVAARAMEHLCTMYEVTAVAEATPAGLLGVMDDGGIDVSVVAPVATRAAQVPSINEWAASIRSERFVPFGAIHPEVEDPARAVERMVELGLKGVKLQANFQAVSPDDRRFYPAYEAARGRLIFLFHSGQEIKEVPFVHAQPAALARVRAEFPGLTMVAAHMGGYRMWEEVRAHLLGRDVVFDMSYCAEDDIPAESLAELIREHGAERVVFGSDFPWGDPRDDLRRLLGLGLSAEEVEAIAWRNADALLGLELG